MLFTLQDALEFLKPYIKNGSCNDTTATARINEAQRRLLMRPEKPVMTERVMRFCLDNSTITLPREVEKIEKVNSNAIPQNVFGMAYEFLPGGPGSFSCDGWSCTYNDLVDMGDGWPTFFDIPSKERDTDTWQDCGDTVTSPKYLIAFSTDYEDSKLALAAQGKDEHSADILTDAVPGFSIPINRWEGGVEGTVRADGTQNEYTAIQVTDLTAIRKPVTRGYVSLYTYDPGDHRMYFLAKYHPDETSPGYRRYRLADANFTTPHSVMALVTLRYVPAKHANDLLLVQNLDALKLMCMAIDRENERDFSEAKAYEADAVRLLTAQKTRNRNYATEFSMIDPYGFGGIGLKR